MFEQAKRLKILPPYLFAKLDKMKQEAVRKGVDVISFGIGDPDIPTPGHIVRSLQKACANPLHHRYPSYEGMLSFRQVTAIILFIGPGIPSVKKSTATAST